MAKRRGFVTLNQMAYETRSRVFAAAGQEAPVKLVHPRNVSLILRRIFAGTVIAPTRSAKPEIER
jgi:hypothetical protein